MHYYYYFCLIKNGVCPNKKKRKKTKGTFWSQTWFILHWYFNEFFVCWFLKTTSESKTLVQLLSKKAYLSIFLLLFFFFIGSYNNITLFSSLFVAKRGEAYCLLFFAILCDAQFNEVFQEFPSASSNFDLKWDSASSSDKSKTWNNKKIYWGRKISFAENHKYQVLITYACQQILCIR